jgi:hypothetical protein
MKKMSDVDNFDKSSLQKEIDEYLNSDPMTERNPFEY